VLLWLAVGVAGGAGALARFALDAVVGERLGSGFPWGTLAVNLSGAFALGVIAGAAVHGHAVTIVGTGLLGSYTTFSTWMLESQRLGEDGQPWLLVANLALTLAAGLGAVALGRAL
jgi:fluoride exporter